MKIDWIEEVLLDLKNFSALNGLARLTDALEEAIRQTQVEARRVSAHGFVEPPEADGAKPPLG